MKPADLDQHSFQKRIKIFEKKVAILYQMLDMLNPVFLHLF